LHGVKLTRDINPTNAVNKTPFKIWPNQIIYANNSYLHWEDKHPYKHTVNRNSLTTLQGCAWTLGFVNFRQMDGIYCHCINSSPHAMRSDSMQMLLTESTLQHNYETFLLLFNNLCIIFSDNVL